MEDKQIVQLYLDRSEEALTQTRDKYGKYCSSIAFNVLGDLSDAEECVNDTYLKLWKSIPPVIPSSLKAYIGKICRNLSLDLYTARHAQKRGGGTIESAIDELADIIAAPAADDPQQNLEAEELTQAINRFLGEISPEKRMVFVRRYWYLDSVKQVAARFGWSESRVKVTLSRLRKQLKDFLQQEGIEI